MDNWPRHSIIGELENHSERRNEIMWGVGRKRRWLVIRAVKYMQVGEGEKGEGGIHNVKRGMV
jgi:hypothetical protein